MTINTFLFDLDGTLVDSATDLTNVLAQLLTEAKQVKDVRVFRQYVGRGAVAMIAAAFPNISASELAKKQTRFLKIYQKDIAKHTRLFQGMAAVLDKIKAQGGQWGVVTNKSSENTHLLLKALSLLPDVVVCGDTLAVKKPAPEPLLYACRQLSVTHKQAVFIGDDINDILAARAAKMSCVAVRYGYGAKPNDWQADWLIDKPSALLTLPFFL